MNFLDRVIAFFSPARGLRRARARHAVEILRGFEGSSRGKRTQGWLTSGMDADAEASAALTTLRNRSRDLVRNNPYAARGVSVIVSNMIGTGIIPQPQDGKKRASKQILDLWAEWAETRDCDFDGLHDMYGLQALIVNTLVQSGEVLVRRVMRTDKDKKVPLQIQVLEPDFIDVSKNQDRLDSGGGWIKNGLEYDAQGRVVAYYLFKQHPGSSAPTLGGQLQSSRVDASQLLHILRGDRPGQRRGIPWLAPVMIKLRDFDDYEDAQLVRQKIAACFAAFITTDEAIDDERPAAISDRLDPGAVEVLPSGKSIQFNSPPVVQGYGEYTSVVLRSISVGLGVPYESLTGDLTGVNFSSARMGWLEFHRNIEQWRWKIIVPQFCDPVWAWFVQAIELRGARADGVKAYWTPPRREMINPTEEINSSVTAIRAGLTTLSEELRKQGHDPRRILEEKKADNDLMDELGLVLDSDPRKVMKAGSLQPDLSPAAPPKPSGE